MTVNKNSDLQLAANAVIVDSIMQKNIIEAIVVYYDGISEVIDAIL